MAPMTPYEWKSPESFAYREWRKMVQHAHDSDPDINRPFFCALAMVWQMQYEIFEALTTVREKK